MTAIIIFNIAGHLTIRKFGWLQMVLFSCQVSWNTVHWFRWCCRGEIYTLTQTWRYCIFLREEEKKKEIRKYLLYLVFSYLVVSILRFNSHIKSDGIAKILYNFRRDHLRTKYGFITLFRIPKIWKKSSFFWSYVHFLFVCNFISQICFPIWYHLMQFCFWLEPVL
jgi:hypothetical protein